MNCEKISKIGEEHDSSLTASSVARGPFLECESRRYQSVAAIFKQLLGSSNDEELVSGTRPRWLQNRNGILI